MTDDFTAVARLLDALRPWLGHVVIVGGWAHRLHRFHDLAHAPAYLPLRTRDADVALPPTMSRNDDVGSALGAAGFTKDFTGEHTPPVTHYKLGSEDQGFYAEFLVPLRGSGYTRRGDPDVTVRISGVIAQKLRHLDVLLIDPWTVRLDASLGVPLNGPVDVQVPNAVSFLAQKLLIQKDRTRDKQAQDALYVHDTLELFGPSLDQLAALWRDRVSVAIGARLAKEVGRLAAEQYASMTDVIRSAARMPQDRRLPPERMRAVCAFGLRAVFLDSAAALRSD
jgi:hypothetical protein